MAKNLSTFLRGVSYGNIPVTSGGTGLTSPGTTGNVLTSNGSAWVSSPAPVSLPSQTGNSGKYLTSDGTTASWGSSTGSGNVVLSTNSLLTTPTVTGHREVKVAMTANAIDLAIANYFSKTITVATTLTVSNVPAANTVGAFILDLTNGGAFTITWWANIKWVGGTAPVLTAAGRDAIGFFTHDGGSSWTGFVLGKDIK